MDRPIFQTGALPRTTDVLNASKFAMYGLGYLIEAAIGPNTGIAGLAFGLVGGGTPLAFTIGRGSIYTVVTADTTAYSTLGTDSNSVGKQGINPTPQTYNLATAVGALSSGYSQYVLVEFAYSDVDSGSTVLPFYNAANPSSPYSGPSNSGSSSYTIRQGKLNITLKYGTAAPTGSQAIPSVDVGYVPGYVILIYNGMTTLTSSDYYIYPNAAFFPNLESLKSSFVQIVPSTTFYVNSSTGSDSAGNGSASNPWLTIQNAVNVLSAYNFASQTVTIQLQNTGTFAGPVSVNVSLGGTLVIRGNPAAQGSYTISGNAPLYGGLVGVFGGAQVSLVGLTLACQNTGVVQNLIVAQATCTLQNVTFGGVAGTFNLLCASSSGNINIYAGCIFAQSSVSAMTSANGSSIIFFANVTTSGSPVWGTACAIAYSTGSYGFGGGGGWTFTNTGATGIRYNAYLNGVIAVGGAATWFPGNASGTTTTGGQYA